MVREKLPTFSQIQSSSFETKVTVGENDTAEVELVAVSLVMLRKSHFSRGTNSSNPYRYLKKKNAGFVISTKKSPDLGENPNLAILVCSYLPYPGGNFKNECDQHPK